jgi:hypothetical protein
MTYTELNDLKTAWQTLSQNLERQNRLTVSQLREAKRRRFRSGFRLLVAGQILQLLAGVLLAVWSASFWVAHIGSAHLMIEGITVHLYAISLIIFAARDLQLIRSFDYAAPVLEMQKRFAELRAWHRVAAIWFGVTSSLIWVPLLLIVFAKLGADVWARNPQVVGWLALSGLVSVAIFLGVVGWSRRPGREKFARALDATAAGYSVRRAQSVLEEIAEFERG